MKRWFQWEAKSVVHIGSTLQKCGNGPSGNNQISKQKRYMDDILAMFAPSDPDPLASIKVLNELCEDIGLPLAEDKYVPPTTLLTFLGIAIDTRHQTLVVPEDKLVKARVKIDGLLSRRKAKVRQILSITGLLAFICRAIPSGHPFLQRLFDVVRGKPKHIWVQDEKDTKQDLRTWLRFLDTFNGTTLFPPVAQSRASEIEIYTDASLEGYGIVCGTSWIMQPFPKFLEPQPSMTWREFYPILVAVHAFESVLANKKVVFITDNMGVFHIIRSLTTPHTDILDLLRQFVLQCLNIKVI